MRQQSSDGRRLVLAAGAPVIRAGDQATSVSGAGTAGGSPVAVSGGTVEVASAGQTSVLAGD